MIKLDEKRNINREISSYQEEYKMKAT